MVQKLHLLMKRIHTDSSSSRLAAIMKQREILATKFLHQEAVSSVLASSTQSLGEFEVNRTSNFIKFLASLMELPQPS